MSFAREPGDEELASLLQQVKQFCEDGQAQREQVGDLASLVLSDVRPGHVILHDEPNEPRTPRLGAATMLGGGDQPRRHIVARIPYTDQRADKFLANEAGQLPRDQPGLIMVDATREPTAFRSWAPILSRRFQANLHTRVGGLCLFAPQMLPIARGFLWIPQVRLYSNPHARLPLPDWAREALTEAADIFTMVFEDIQRPSSG